MHDKASERKPAFVLLLSVALWNVFLAMTGAYGISLTLFFLLRWSIGEDSNIVALMNNFVHIMLLPSLILLPVALVLRRRIVIGALVIPFLIGAWDNVPMFLNGTPAAPANAQVIPVLTYNLYAGQPVYDRSLEIIREANADIVALQEVTRWGADQLIREMSDEYPYIALHPQLVPTAGQGILSRYPILEDEYFQSDVPNRLGHQRVVLDVNGRNITIYNVHPLHPGMVQLDVSLRTEEIQFFMQRVIADKPNSPVMVLGDFNMTPKTEDYAFITETAQFTDAFKVAGNGLGYTFPDADYPGIYGHLPLLARLDYMFYDEDWQVVEIDVWNRSGGSDHRPIFARLVLLDSPAQ